MPADYGKSLEARRSNIKGRSIQHGISMPLLRSPSTVCRYQIIHGRMMGLPCFTTKGTGVRVYATIPQGTGTGVVDYSLSPGSSLRVWQKSGSTAVYGKEVFYSGVLPLGSHTLVMSNMGEDNDMDFELDRIVVELEGSSNTSTQTCEFPDSCFEYMGADHVS